MSNFVTIDHMNIPALTARTLAMYLIHHVRPGGFIQAVLCNDLFEAVGRADSQNLICLGDIVKIIHENFPMSITRPMGYQAWLENTDKNWHDAVQRYHGDVWSDYAGINPS